MSSKLDSDAKHGDDGEEEDEDEISSSGDEDDASRSDDEMSESGDVRGGAGGEAKSVVGAPSGGATATKPGSERSLQNQPFDEALDLSESEDNGGAGRGAAEDSGGDSPKKAGKTLKNLPFDEALDLSASAQDLESPIKQAQEQGAAKTMTLAAAAGAKSVAEDEDAVGAELKNNPFDAEVDLSDSGESVDTNEPSSPKKGAPKAGSAAAASASASSSAFAPTAGASAAMQEPTPTERKPSVMNSKPAPLPASANKGPEPSKTPVAKPKHVSKSSSEESGSEDDDDDEEEEEDEDEDEEEEDEDAANKRTRAGGGGGGGASAAASGGAGGAGGTGSVSAAHATMVANAGGYKESDYVHLKVSTDIKELFQYIGRFKPQELELETRLKCFIPEYIPAVGDMDAFLKIPRPDGELDQLGLKMLDEPSLAQSDATVLDLQLRATSKKKHGDLVVRSLENAEKTPKEIDRWIKSIAELHRTKPPPQVHYTKPMPDIESLMQVWPDEFEELLGKTTLPGASLDLALEPYIRVICAILDIPIYKNVYESLHVLFTLYLEFRCNQHFMNYDEPMESSNNPAGGAGLDQAPPPFSSRRDDVGFQDEYLSSSSRK